MPAAAHERRRELLDALQAPLPVREACAHAAQGPPMARWWLAAARQATQAPPLQGADHSRRAYSRPCCWNRVTVPPCGPRFMVAAHDDATERRPVGAAAEQQVPDAEYEERLAQRVHVLWLQ